MLAIALRAIGNAGKVLQTNEAAGNVCKRDPPPSFAIV